MMRWAAAVGVLLLAAQTAAAAPNWAALDARPYEPPKPAPALVDRKGDVTGLGYGVFGPPTAYLIDRQGRLVARIVGERDWSTPAVKTLLLEVLKQPAR